MFLKEFHRNIKAIFKKYRLIGGKLLLDRRFKKSTKIEISEQAKLIFLRYDNKLGDMVINSLVFREIKRCYPLMKIVVIAGPLNRLLIEKNPYVDEIYLYSKNWLQLWWLAKKIRSTQYHFLFDFSEQLRNRELFFINCCQAKYNIGVYKKNYRIFDFSLETLQRDHHIVYRYQAVLELLKIKNAHLGYDLYIDPIHWQSMQFFLKQFNNKKIVCLNCFGAGKYRSFTQERAQSIIELLLQFNSDWIIILIYPKEKIDFIIELAQLINDPRVLYPENISNLDQSIAIIAQADLVITPDTSIVHFAVAFNKPLIAVYLQNKNEYIKWHPNSTNAHVIFSRLPGRAYEQVQVSEFDIQELKLALEKVAI